MTFQTLSKGFIRVAHLQQKVQIARQYYGLLQLAAIRNGDNLLSQYHT
jgi:hypothetical protein